VGFQVAGHTPPVPPQARWTSSFEREAEQSEIYQYLVANYANQV
jgi:hypothetical protein